MERQRNPGRVFEHRPRPDCASLPPGYRSPYRSRATPCIGNDERVVPFSASTLSTEPGSTEGGGGAGPGFGSLWVGDGHEARPQGIVPPAGATNADVTPLLAPPHRGSRFGAAAHLHARPSGSATNLVDSPDFTRISTVRLPPWRASLSAVRTSD